MYDDYITKGLKKQSFFPEVLKEGAHHSSNFFSHYSAFNFDAMVKSLHFLNADNAPQGTEFRFSGAVDNPLDPRMVDRPRAHQARLQSDIDGGIIEY